MIVEAMNYTELATEIMRDFDRLRDITELRLFEQYDKERRKFKIDKCKTYPKVYPIKTGSKNTWLLSFSKKPVSDKYKGEDTVHVGYAVYFYTSKGLTAVKVAAGGFLELFYGHFFKRYNERMKLNLDKPVDILQRYFMYGTDVVYKIVKNGDEEKTIGITPEGILLAAIRGNRKWVVNKTFVSKDLAHASQDETERELISSLKADILKAMINGKANDENEAFRIKNNVVHTLTNSYV